VSRASLIVFYMNGSTICRFIKVKVVPPPFLLFQTMQNTRIILESRKTNKMRKLTIVSRAERQQGLTRAQTWYDCLDLRHAIWLSRKLAFTIAQLSSPRQALRKDIVFAAFLSPCKSFND
jgi:hypothetical protein